MRIPDSVGRVTRSSGQTAVCVVLLILVPACGSGGSRRAAERVEAEATIGAAGGVVEVTDPASPLHGVRLSVPPGALTGDVTFKIKTLKGEGAPFTRSVMQAAIEPSGTRFLIPAHLDLPYSDDDGDGVVDGLGVSELLLRAFASTARGFEEVAPAARELAGNVVRLPVDHLSGFVLAPPYQLKGPTIQVLVDMSQSGLNPGPSVGEARSTIVEAVRSGPFGEKLTTCLGWDISSTAIEVLADVRIRWLDFAAAGLMPNGLAFTNILPPDSPVPTSPDGPFDIYINNRIKWHVDLDPLTDPQPDEFELFSVVAHEFAHTLGLPSDHWVGQSLPGDHCLPELYDGAAVVGERLAPGILSVKRELQPFDEAFFLHAYPLVFGQTLPHGNTGFVPTTVSFEVATSCATHPLDIASSFLSLDENDGRPPLRFDHLLIADVASDGTSAVFSLDLAPLSIPGPVEVVAGVADECGRLRQISWTFSVGGSVSFLETWTAATNGVYGPNSPIHGSAATWLLQDTVSEFPDCGNTPQRGFIEVGASGHELRLLSADSPSVCSDNVWVVAFPSIPLTPGLHLNFNATGVLHQPQVNPHNNHLGDRIYLGVIDDQGHVIFYTIEHAEGLVPFDGPSGVFNVNREFFLSPNNGADGYARDVHADFAALSGFREGARITSLLFEVHEHGEATLDNLLFSHP